MLRVNGVNLNGRVSPLFIFIIYEQIEYHISRKHVIYTNEENTRSSCCFGIVFTYVIAYAEF